MTTFVIVASAFAVLALVALTAFVPRFRNAVQWLYKKALLGLVWLGLALGITALGVLVLVLMLAIAVPTVIGKLLATYGAKAIKALEKFFMARHNALVGLGFKASKRL